MFSVEDFRQYVHKFLQEFVSRGYCVEIEFSTKDEYIPVKSEVLQEEVKNFGLDGVYEFLMYYCEVCKGHHKDRPIHVILVEYGEEY